MSIDSNSVVDDARTFSPGAPKSKYFEFERQMEVDDCQISIALARPWLFSGFEEDGTVTDLSTTVKSFIIPIRT